ncbi:MAG: GIY-YIG nuclease family protein [Candidatus Nomurabacteria bacterium]|nr:MAG: GIY-YIG nuclease family protein [Candidatus Nomurabacteria bacterium]
MTKADLNLSKLPDSPGVYFFIGRKKEILYIGKATSIKQRVKSYFTNDLTEKRSELIAKMVKEALQVEFTVTDSVIEALILETNLIRTHKPLYNTRTKDDKSYNHLIITKETWPRVLVVRGKDLSEKYTEDQLQYTFGPFISASLLKEALKITRKLFKFYDTKKSVERSKSKLARGIIDFNRQIGLYPKETDIKTYKRNIHQLALFFSGQKEQIIKELEKEMMQLAKKEKFEEANYTKKKIFALKHIQDIALVKDDYRTYKDDTKQRIEAYDVAHHASKDMVAVMTVIENGETRKSEYRKFKIKTVTKANDPEALKETLTRRLNHSEWPLPQIIVVDGNIVQKRVAERVLKTLNLTIPVVAVVKNDQHKVDRIIASDKILKTHKFDILLANAEAHRFAISFHRRKARLSLLK